MTVLVKAADSVLLLCLVACLVGFALGKRGVILEANEAAENVERDIRALQDEMKPYVLDMLRHAFDMYMRYGFPKDEVHPVSCTGEDTMGGFALTLVDSLDLLALSGYHDEFRRHCKWVAEHIDFDKDFTVSVFETSIRVLGGLLSAHFMYEQGIVEVDPSVDDYRGALLQLAVKLGDRLLPAFDSPTGIPFGSINLMHGVHPTEIDITSTAGGGTYLPEFTVLSAVTGDRAYEDAARRAYRALFHFRSAGLGLVGNHINITNGQWTIEVASVGSGVDSFVEYGIKAYLMTGLEEYRAMFFSLRDSFHRYTRKGPYYVASNMFNGGLSHISLTSLSAFYPGSLVLAGLLREAAETVVATHAVAKKLGALPEAFSLLGSHIEEGQAGFPLRPEHAESLYMLFRATRDITFLEMAKEVALMINTRTRTRCGFSALNHVGLPPHSQKLTDTMESFILAETLKYLLLIFDDHNPLHQFQQGLERRHAENHGDSSGFLDSFGFFNNNNSTSAPLPVPWLFNTEGHPLPVTGEWRQRFRYTDEYDGTVAALLSGSRFDRRHLFDEHRCFTEPLTELDRLPRDIFRRDHWSGGGL